MWGKGLLAAAAAFLISIGAASAQTRPSAMTTKSLYQDCTSDNQMARIACIMYLRGVADFADVMGAGYEKNKKTKPDWASEDRYFAICDAKWTGTSLRETFVAWVDKNPSAANESPFYGVIRALKDQWPCQ